jgi:hypothetical protein
MDDYSASLAGFLTQLVEKMFNDLIAGEKWSLFQETLAQQED